MGSALVASAPRHILLNSIIQRSPFTMCAYLSPPPAKILPNSFPQSRIYSATSLLDSVELMELLLLSLPLLLLIFTLLLETLVVQSLGDQQGPGSEGQEQG